MYTVDHQNFFGIDENIGPIAISLKRERIPDEVVEFYGIMGSAPKYQHRVIVRTSQVCIYLFVQWNCSLCCYRILIIAVSHVQFFLRLHPFYINKICTVWRIIFVGANFRGN